MNRQLDLFDDVDDFLKEQALDTRYVLQKYGYDLDGTYEIIRMNYCTHKYEIVVWWQGKEQSVATFDHISDCCETLYQVLKDRKYEYSVEMDKDFIYYQIHKLLD